MAFLRPILLVCAVWCFSEQVYALSAQIRSGPSACQTSETCISIRQCPSARRNILNECGKEHGSYKVCCPSTSHAVAKRQSTENFEICGKSKKKNEFSLRIADGEKSKSGNWPWMVALFKKEILWQFKCGACLISVEWVITAAHCVQCKATQCKENKLKVLLGSMNIVKGTEKRKISKIVTHGYIREPSFNDIALLQLNKPVTFAENIRPICLPSGGKYLDDTYYNDKTAFIAGWGKTEDSHKKMRDNLREVSLNVITLENCAKRYELEDVTINETVICAGGFDKGRGACEGDSGGPLMFYNDDTDSFHLGGIMTGTDGCGKDYSPGVFTKVAQHMDWIGGCLRSAQ